MTYVRVVYSIRTVHTHCVVRLYAFRLRLASFYLFAASQADKRPKEKMSTQVPQLRNLLRRKIGRDIVIALGLSVVTGGAWWFTVVRPRRIKYANFYENYDANAVAQATKASFEED